jgi:hypothetical protein
VGQKRNVAIRSDHTKRIYDTNLDVATAGSFIYTSRRQLNIRVTKLRNRPALQNEGVENTL